MTPEREIHTGVDVALDHPSIWRLYAECANATTDIFVMGDALLMPVDEDAFASSEWPTLLIGEHLARCEDCAAWRRRAS